MLNFSFTTGWRTTSVRVVHGADLQAAIHLANALQFLDLAEIDDHFRPLRSFSQSKLSRPPASTQAFEPCSWTSESASFRFAGWKELESKHDIIDYRHFALSCTSVPWQIRLQNSRYAKTKRWTARRFARVCPLPAKRGSQLSGPENGHSARKPEQCQDFKNSRVRAQASFVAAVLAPTS